jgi:hypothetical protein
VKTVVVGWLQGVCEEAEEGEDLARFSETNDSPHRREPGGQLLAPATEHPSCLLRKYSVLRTEYMSMFTLTN